MNTADEYDCIVAGAGTAGCVIAARLSEDDGARVLGAAAMVWLAQLTPSSSYAGHVLPALLVLGVGTGSSEERTGVSCCGERRARSDR